MAEPRRSARLGSAWVILCRRRSTVRMSLQRNECCVCVRGLRNAGVTGSSPVGGTIENPISAAEVTVTDLRRRRDRPEHRRVACPGAVARGDRPKPVARVGHAFRVSSCSIHASICASRTSSGTAPSPSTASWNRRTSKRAPSLVSARLRSARMRSSPIL